MPCFVQGREGGKRSLAQKGPSSKDGQSCMARSAATSLALSRHPDLAEAPVLDLAVDTPDDADLDGLLSQRRKRAAATAFVPLAVTPAVERMLQVRLAVCTVDAMLAPPTPSGVGCLFQGRMLVYPTSLRFHASSIWCHRKGLT